MPDNTALSDGATAYWDGDEDTPVFVHKACRINSGDIPWAPVRGSIEILDEDRCQGCGGSLFKEPVE